MCGILKMFVNSFLSLIGIGNLSSSSDRRAFCLRISEVPLWIDEKSLTTLLNTLPLISDTQQPGPLDNVFKLTLAPCVNGHFQVATVNFHRVPLLLEPLMSNPGSETLALDVGDRPVRLTFDSKFTSLTPLNNPDSPTLDIFAITKLAGHGFDSWQAIQTGIMWIRDLLPIDLLSEGIGARVFAYAYSSRNIGSESTAEVEDLARSLLEAFRRARQNMKGSQTKILIICHGFSGIVVKQALCLANMSNDPRSQEIIKSCTAVLFFGVPHKGLEEEGMINLIKQQPNKWFKDNLSTQSPYLMNLDKEFIKLCETEKIELASFYETEKTPPFRQARSAGGWKEDGCPTLIVTKESAIASTGRIRNLPLYRKHSDLIRFTGHSDSGYETVFGIILELAEKATAEFKRSKEMCAREIKSNSATSVSSRSDGNSSVSTSPLPHGATAPRNRKAIQTTRRKI